MALRDPQRITAIITQSGNAYTAGFVKPFWTGVWAYGQNPGPDYSAAGRPST